MNNMFTSGINMDNNMPMNQNIECIDRMNPQMNMNNGMNGINPMMNPLNPQIPIANNMGQMPMNQIGMIPGIMSMLKPLTEQQKKELRKKCFTHVRYIPNLAKIEKAAANIAPAPIVQESPITGELEIKFNKNGNITIVKIDADDMVAELLNEYFVKTGTTTGNFKFNGNILSPSDITSLADKGLRNNSEIIVY